MDACKLAILLPVTSRTSGKYPGPPPACGTAHHYGAADRPAIPAAIHTGLSKLAASLSVTGGSSNDADSRHSITVLLGIDSDDDLLLQHQQQLLDAFASAAGSVHVMVFSEADRAGYPPGAVCHLWGIMAAAAVEEYGCNLAVLLGVESAEHVATTTGNWFCRNAVERHVQQNNTLLTAVHMHAVSAAYSIHGKYFGSYLVCCFCVRAPMANVARCMELGGWLNTRPSAYARARTWPQLRIGVCPVAVVILCTNRRPALPNTDLLWNMVLSDQIECLSKTVSYCWCCWLLHCKGDDIEVSPPGWPSQVISTFMQQRRPDVAAPQ